MTGRVLGKVTWLSRVLQEGYRDWQGVVMVAVYVGCKDSHVVTNVEKVEAGNG